MADVVDADELLRRIRVARDWAADQAAGSGEDGDPGEPAAVRRAAFAAVRAVLDEIISPGTHAG
ncbi:hypothetical protein V1L54_15695 [Streptomyces sp. TRM 70361]|uniref:hypothetical protein n=1 Tax=Streptomyces sp. TRM 70361 TaxID=3116553 RepID=UPI002E7B55C6|nr:hypothetical protein [Streptomyces sp. TRM 70361]MEE1940830.1 hypothetical protein [Streptomyces sp. TRM 70361]